MPGPDLLAAILAALAVTFATAAALLPPPAPERIAARRVRDLAARAPRGGGSASRTDLLQARLQAMGQARSGMRLRLERLLEQAGLGWSFGRCLGAAAAIAAVSCALAMLLFKSVLVGPAVGLAAGWIGPWFYLRHRRDRRMVQCADELPNALDLMVRGLRAGRPLGDCIRTVGREAREPVGREFRLVEHEQQLGASLAQAMERLAVRLPIDETRFLAIAVSVQTAEGGSLAETLSNLARTLRERRRVLRKLAAMSAEQTMSARLLAVLPLVILVLVHQINPPYLAVLFSTSAGQVILGLSMLWLAIGFLVLSRMTRLEV